MFCSRWLGCSPSGQAAWQVEVRTGRKALHHPVAGDLDLTYEAFELPSEPGLAMLVYTAEPDTPTAQALDFLASWATSRLSGRTDQDSDIVLP